MVNLVGDTTCPEIMAAYPSAPWARVAEGSRSGDALELLRAAIGVPDIPVVIENIATWQAVADCAERFQDRHACSWPSDAAHVRSAERRLRQQHGCAGRA